MAKRAAGAPEAAQPGENATDDLAGVRSWLDEEIAGLARESAEIAMLIAQTQSEVERNDARRSTAEARIRELEGAPRPDPVAVTEARDQLLAIGQRQAMMLAESTILEGKQKALLRYRERVEALSGQLAQVTVNGAGPTGGAGGSRGAAGAEIGGSGNGEADATLAVLRAQEDLRRDIARQMHDGPAQSLANIALQAEIVQRLLSHDPARAAVEVEQLRRTVQVALDATKTFIFDVRPMVLDDLGLVPTLRRVAADRGRRTGVAIDFDSAGADHRLPPDLESAVFRIIDDALAGYVGLRPSALSVRLDWSKDELRATVRSGRPEERVRPPMGAALDGPPDTPELPPALAAMIEEQRADEHEAWAHARALPDERWREIRGRAEAIGVVVRLLDEGQTLEAIAPIAA